MLTPGGNPQSDTAKTVLLATLAAVTAYYIFMFIRALILQGKRDLDTMPTPAGLGTGFVTNFFDVLGIGSFATTTAVFKLLKMVPDEKYPWHSQHWSYIKCNHADVRFYKDSSGGGDDADSHDSCRCVRFLVRGRGRIENVEVKNSIRHGLRHAGGRYLNVFVAPRYRSGGE